jgi:hypothetical protein
VRRIVLEGRPAPSRIRDGDGIPEVVVFRFA